MKKSYIVVFVIIIFLLISSFYLGNLLIKENNIKVNKDEINNIDDNQIYNISKTNEISKYIPRFIKNIIILNNLSDKNNPTTINIEEVDKIEEFMNLIFTTKWEEMNENQISNFDGAFYQITLIGDTEIILNMQGYGGYNATYGIVKIEDRYYYIDKSIYQEMTNFATEKYYLHDSNLELPTQQKCYDAQEKVFNELTEEEKKNLQENIRLIHNELEYQLLDSVRLIKDSNSPYWEDFTNYGVFTDPFTGTNVENGGRFLYVLDELAEIKDIPKNKQAINDLQNAYNILKDGMDKHNLSKCFEVHKIIHDYDYWIINTPVYLETEPVEWGGIHTYFGKNSIIK